VNLLHVSCALACLCLIGCEPVWDAANRPGLESDIRALLKTAAVEAPHLQCRMAGATRDGSCALRLSPSDTEAVIRTFALESVRPSTEPSVPLAQLIAQAGPSCVVHASGPLATFGRGGRPDALRLASGAAFEYLLLTINESTGEACVQVSYAYG
jgi:hypothetical protein